MSRTSEDVIFNDGQPGILESIRDPENVNSFVQSMRTSDGGLDSDDPNFQSKPKKPPISLFSLSVL